MKLEVPKAISHRVTASVPKQVPALLERKPIVLPNDSEDYEITRLYIDDLIASGFKRGAVVTSMSYPVDAMRINPEHWGIIMGHVSMPNLSVSPRRLIRVKWLNGSVEECNETSLRIVMTPWWNEWDDLLDRISKPIHPIT